MGSGEAHDGNNAVDQQHERGGPNECEEFDAELGAAVVVVEGLHGLHVTGGIQACRNGDQDEGDPCEDGQPDQHGAAVVHQQVKEARNQGENDEEQPRDGQGPAHAGQVVIGVPVLDELGGHRIAYAEISGGVKRFGDSGVDAEQGLAGDLVDAAQAVVVPPSLVKSYLSKSSGVCLQPVQFQQQGACVGA